MPWDLKASTGKYSHHTIPNRLCCLCFFRDSQNWTCQWNAVCYIANSMHAKKQFLNRFSKSFIAFLLVGLVLLLGVTAASPALHKLIHTDADHADHQCAVTMFAHGKIDSVTCEVFVVAPTVGYETTPSVNLFVFSASIENLPRSRAPPSITSPQV